MRPTGIEHASQAPEACALSIGLRAQFALQQKYFTLFPSHTQEKNTLFYEIPAAGISYILKTISECVFRIWSCADIRCLQEESDFLRAEMKSACERILYLIK